MIHAVKVVNSFGNELMIDISRPDETGFIIRSIKGLGPVKAQINTTDLATTDGVTYNSSRVSSRNITIDLVYYPIYPDIVINADDQLLIHKPTNSSDDNYKETRNLSVEDLRQLSYTYFSVKKEISLYFYTDNRTVYIKGYVESNEPDIFSKDEGSSISIICPYPYFKEVNESVSIDFSSVEPRFTFEFEDPQTTTPSLIMGEITEIEEYVIDYYGDVDTGVKLSLYLFGRIGDITIYNTYLNESFSLDADKIESIIGGEISSGDIIVISSLPREKTVKYYKGNEEYNILNAMGRDSDWLTLSHGTNVFSYVTENDNDYLNVSLEYPILYEGI